MRFVLCLFAAILSGCITTYETKRSEDLCTKGGMGYEGFTITGTNKAGDHVGHVRCINPDTKEKKCGVSKAQSVLAEKESYNNRWWMQNVAIGVGYVFYVVPGYLLYEYWDDDAKADMNATNGRIANVQSKECETTAH